MYVLVLADTGVGKEAAFTGISKLMTQVVRAVPGAQTFVGPSQLPSAQGLTRHMASGHTSFMSQIGEVGMFLQSALAKNSTHGLSLKRFITQIYTKSGQHNALNSSTFSDKDKDTGIIIAPAFSLFGESVPGRFYEALDEFIVEDGFVPRMVIIEHPTERVVPFNDGHHKVKPSPEIVSLLSEICTQAITINGQNIACDVEFDEEAGTMQKQFRDWCYTNARSHKESYARCIWTRSHVKALKMAALIAVCQNYFSPVITLTELKWAISLTLKDTYNIIARFERGDTGSPVSESKQSDAVREVMEHWLDIHQVEPNLERMRCRRLVPSSYICDKLYRRSMFAQDRIGAYAAIKRALKMLEETGHIVTVSASEMTANYHTRATVYKIL